MENCGLLLIERAILESLVEGEKTIEQLNQETSIGHAVCIKVLQNFREQKIVLQKNNFYLLNYQEKEKWSRLINNPQGLIEEVEEILHCLLKKKFKKQSLEKMSEVDFSLKKVEIEEKDYKILKSYFYNIAQFIKGLEMSKNKKGSSKRVIFWGEGPYQSLIQESLANL